VLPFFFLSFHLSAFPSKSLQNPRRRPAFIDLDLSGPVPGNKASQPASRPAGPGLYYHRHRRRVRPAFQAHEIMSSEDSLKSLSLDYLNLLINGQAFSDVAFSVEGRLVHAHRCVLAARSLFFRKLFCGLDPNHQPPPTLGSSAAGARAPELVIPVSSIRYEVLVLVLQFLYSGQASVAAPKSGPLPGCGARGCWHTRCGAAVDLALDTLAAARSFGVEQLALLVQVGMGIDFFVLLIITSILGICSCRHQAGRGSYY
jgi:hypothetical protein